MKLRESYKKSFLKAATIHAVSFSLLYSPAAIAQNALLQGAGQLLNGIQGFTQQMQQQRQAAMAQAQMQSQMQALQPQAVPSAYFPNCAISRAVTDFPDGACENPPAPGDAAGAAQLQSFKGLAVSYESFFENLLANNQDPTTARGPQCLQIAAARAETAIQDKINALKALIGKVNKEIQAFDQANRKIKEQMEDVRSELYGNPADQEDRNKTLITQFSGKCQEYFSGNNASIRQGGFSSLRDQMDSTNAQAGRFKNDTKGYEAELSRMVASLEKEIKRGGLSVLSDEASIRSAIFESGSTTAFGSMSALLEAKSRNVQRNLQELQKDLADVGFQMDISDFDGNFQERFANFSEGSFDYFKKEAVSNCVSGADRSLGGGLTTSQILDGLRHRNFGDGGGPTKTLENYKAALTEILDSDAFIQDKMNSIAALDQKFGVGNVFVQTKRAGQTDYPTPYGLYQAQIEYCEAQISQNDTFSTQQGKRNQVTGSYAQRIKRAERALKKALSIEKEFVTDLSASIFNRVKNCEGIEYKQDSCVMGAEAGSSAMTPTAPNFCIAHATTCANQVQGCYQEADTIVKKKQQEMATLGAQHNAQVSNLVARQEFFLNQIKAQVVADAEAIKQSFPGVKYDFPTDLFVTLPEEIMSPKFGVALRGGDSTQSLVKDLPLKMEKLVKILSDQKIEAKKFWKKYVDDQRRGMEQDAKKWTALKEACNDSIDGYNQAVAEANAREAEALGNAANFCQKFDTLATNPMAGCGDADQLYQDSMGIAAGLGAPHLTRQSALEYKNFCNQSNNERERGNEDDEVDADEQFLDLADFCDDESDNFEQELVDRVGDQMPSSFSSSLRSEVKDLLSGEKTDRPSQELRKTPYYRNTLRHALTALDRSEYKIPSLPTVEGSGDHLSQSEVHQRISERAGIDQTLTDANLKSFWDNEETGFCSRLAVERQITAANDCRDKKRDEFNECMDDYNYSSSKKAPKGAARAIASINSSATNSDSQRIGERMQGTPCMAQQGFNGSQGFNLGSFDAGQLGSDAASVINSVTGGR